MRSGAGALVGGGANTVGATVGTADLAGPQAVTITSAMDAIVVNCLGLKFFTSDGIRTDWRVNLLSFNNVERRRQVPFVPPQRVPLAPQRNHLTEGGCRLQ